jgi:hypothetical protein
MDINNNGWNEQLIRQLFIPYEAQQILNIPTLNRSTEDTIIWAGTMDGSYTVKDGYQAIMNWGKEGNNGSASTSTLHEEIWGKLWKLNFLLSTAIFYGEF